MCHLASRAADSRRCLSWAENAKNTRVHWQPKFMLTSFGFRPSESSGRPGLERGAVTRMISLIGTILPSWRLICKCSSGSPRNWQTRKLLPMAALSAASWDSVLRIDATEVSSPQQRAGCLDLPIKRRVRLGFTLVRADCDMRFSHLLTLDNDAEISRWQPGRISQ